MTGPRVVILYEDKTGGGLHRLVSTMVRASRVAAGREPLSYCCDLAMKSNTKLIAECSSFERMRFFQPHRADHVMAVIDAYEVEKVVPKAPKPLGPPLRDDPDAFAEYCRSVDDAVRSHMRSLAFASMTAEARDREEGRFHPRVLFWERESVFLAGGDVLRVARGLDLPEDRTTTDGVLRTRHPTAVVEAAWLARSGLKYSKQINGPQLFGDLAQASPQWTKILNRLPSLKEIVESLSAL